MSAARKTALIYSELPRGNASMACPNEECPEFATPYSANQSDYFWANPGDVVVCIECETPMELVNAGYQVEFLGQRKTAGMKVLCLTCGTEFFTRNQFKMACPNCGEENNLANPALMSGEAVPEKTFEQWLRGATRKTAYDPEVAQLGDMFQRQIENMPPPEDRAAFLPCPEHGDESEKGGTYASFPSAYTEYHCPQGHTFAVRPGTTREEMQSTGRKTASQFTIDGRGFVTGIASEDNTCLICGEAVDKGQEAYVSEWIEGEPQYTVHPLCGKPLLTAVHKKTSNKFLVYGGDAYGVPTIADSEPGVDLFDNLDEAMAEFRHRVEYGRTSQGLSTPLWNSDGTGGVIEVSDDDSETLDIHTATRKRAVTDSRGMEVAFTPDGQPFYPTPCCGSFAKGSTDSETGVVCRICHQEVDEIYGAVPDVPWRTGKTAVGAGRVGQTTLSVQWPRVNYSTPPTKDVVILPDVYHCQECGKELVRGRQNSYGGYDLVHADGDDSHRAYARTRCYFCNNDNPSEVRFRQYAWYDAVECDRCGGVDGRALGD